MFGLESELELVDHSFDGREDGGSGHLRAGLGQLADGRFGGDGPMEEEEEEGEVVGPGEEKWEKGKFLKHLRMFSLDKQNIMCKTDFFKAKILCRWP